ncbi:MAG: RluA family pseudouridine synthase [Pseudomonadota bacterium]
MSDLHSDDDESDREPQDRAVWTVAGADLAPGRLDRALAAAFPELSRMRVKALMTAGAVTAIRGDAETPARDPSAAVDGAVEYRLIPPPPEPSEIPAQAIALRVLHEDDDLVVIDKPAGLAVHPAPGSRDGTLVNALLAHCGETLRGVGGVARPGIVHRLDKDTSGVMVAAKTDAAHRGLVEQFADRAVDRRYRAVARGAPRGPRGVVRGNIGRDPKHRVRMAVFADADDAPGRRAATHYAVREVFGADGATLMDCRLETGRTHQIRAHLAHLGCPLIGDPLYGRGGPLKSLGDVAAGFPRQALHAATLGFIHPRSGHDLVFETPFPPDIDRLVAGLRAAGLAARDRAP